MQTPKQTTAARTQQAPEGFEKYSKLPLLFMAGFAIIFVGITLLAASSMAGGEGSSVSTGAVIFIGPIPLVFGSGPDAPWLILIGVAVAVAMAVMFGVLRRKI
ncbi:MAG: DUF131 domain-containing protein [Candidatus Bathyarchaeota archaeon]|nr:DUF131 domain-containing protein [Candidatus Bathyarchaeota archaeon]